MEQDLTNGSVDIMKPVTLGGNSQVLKSFQLFNSLKEKQICLTNVETYFASPCPLSVIIFSFKDGGIYIIQ